jgi:hypothetical protein
MATEGMLKEWVEGMMMMMMMMMIRMLRDQTGGRGRRGEEVVGIVSQEKFA